MKRKPIAPLETKCVKHPYCTVKHFCDAHGMIIEGRKKPEPCRAYATSYPVRYGK